MNTKPGYKTTEFYVQIAAQLLAAAVAFGLLSSDAADAVSKAVGATVAAVAAIVGAVSYGRDRSRLKSFVDE